MSHRVDITPTPRILRTLGDIPFEVWQCLAELADNSLDAFLEAKKAGKEIVSPRIDIYWSAESTPLRDREIIVQDNGLGMPLEDLQNAAKAGYTSNDPIHNLGLFGMGFNIATARLGDETIFLSATKASDSWVGIKINFEELISNKSFSAPVITEKKQDPSESGTKIIVRKLKDGIFPELKARARTIRSRLETIYSPILETRIYSIFLQGNQLISRPHCAWGESRYVTRRGDRIYAVQKIERDLGETHFDTFRNRYLSPDESSELEAKLSKGETLPQNIVKRSRKFRGWIGIQRYSDTSDFGLDLIRNGRKILVGDKSLFEFENPETGTPVADYPIELGSTVGGRIVGELHVDYLIPTYQKNGFDTTDLAWRKTVDAIRGAGPILPKRRQALGYSADNDSPLGRLVNAYRRADPGTKNLAIPNQLAREFTKEFRAGNPDYQNDDKWYRAAQEVDREKGEGTGRSTPAATGSTPSDDPDEYTPQPAAAPAPPAPQSGPSGAVPSPTTTTRDNLIQSSSKEESLSGRYAYGTTPGIDVTTRRLKDGEIKVRGERVPYQVYPDGIELEFIYDPTHPLFAEYPISPKQLILQVLAERFSLRDPGVSMQKAFVGLVVNHLSEERIVASVLQERAQAIINQIKDKLPSLLMARSSKAIGVIKEIPGEEEDLAKRLIEETPHVFKVYQDEREDAVQALPYVNNATVLRLIKALPEEFFDGKLFDAPYENISMGNPDVQKRLRQTSLDKIVSYLNDVCLLLQGSRSLNKHELIRHTQTMSIIEGLMVS